jgi:hypothetical protein
MRLAEALFRVDFSDMYKDLIENAHKQDTDPA